MIIKVQTREKFIKIDDLLLFDIQQNTSKVSTKVLTVVENLECQRFCTLKYAENSIFHNFSKNKNPCKCLIYRDNIHFDF